MSLVGVRDAERGREFMLQNWWADKQFVVVDEEYLRACGVQRVWFVTTPQTRLRDEVKRALIFVQRSLETDVDVPEVAEQEQEADNEQTNKKV